MGKRHPPPPAHEIARSGRKSITEQLVEARNKAVEECACAAERQLLKLIEGGVPVAAPGETLHVAPYVQALQLALKAGGRLIDRQEVRTEGTVTHSVLLPLKSIRSVQAERIAP
jgi:hypothetical protein